MMLDEYMLVTLTVSYAWVFDVTENEEDSLDADTGPRAPPTEHRRTYSLWLLRYHVLLE